jgi:hypothetical protein
VPVSVEEPGDAQVLERAPSQAERVSHRVQSWFRRRTRRGQIAV